MGVDFGKPGADIVVAHFRFEELHQFLELLVLDAAVAVVIVEIEVLAQLVELLLAQFGHGDAPRLLCDSSISAARCAIQSGRPLPLGWAVCWPRLGLCNIAPVHGRLDARCRAHCWWPPPPGSRAAPRHRPFSAKIRCPRHRALPRLMPPAPRSHAPRNP